MKYIKFILLVCLAASLPAAAEEISLKDGTKIVGHMTAISGDKIEVETSYGKIQLKRSDIVTIHFPENGGSTATSNGAATSDAAGKAEARLIDEVLNGTQYVNRTGQFVLSLPTDWVMSPEMRHTPETLAALSSKDKMRFLLIMREDYPGSLESYKEVTMLSARKNLSNFEELADSTVTIDGKPSLLTFYRGNLQKGSNLPVEFLSAIISSGKTYTKVTVWCVEPLFRDMQPAFEKILNSYRSTGAQTASAGSKP